MHAQELRALVGRNILARRKELGLSQVELAAALQISQAYLSQIERGVRSIDVDWLAVFAEKLRTSPQVLMSIEPAFAQE